MAYVLLAFLRGDLVEHRHWLTEAQLLDAVAIGQRTPGPVFTTAIFIGYVLGRTMGAALATIGIFLPAFFFVALSGLLGAVGNTALIPSGFSKPEVCFTTTALEVPAVATGLVSVVLIDT